MNKNIIRGTADITHQGIKKHFKKWETDPFQSIIELIANGFDASATNVEVTIERNAAHGLEAITVLDNGTGIDIDKCDMHFSRFNESIKQGDDDQQGAHGKGRLAFHLLCANAVWYAKCEKSESKITIDSASLRNFVAEEITPEMQHASLSSMKSGSCVVLKNFHKNLPELATIKKRLESYFGWRLALNPDRTLTINGEQIEIPENKSVEKVIDIDGIAFQVDLVLWTHKPGDEKSYNYIVNNEGRVLYRELSSFNKKPNFHLSTYARSTWLNNFDKHDSSLNFSEHPHATLSSPEFRKLRKIIQDLSGDIYKQFLRDFVDKKIDEFDSKGYFPKYKNLSNSDATWRKKNTKLFIREIYLTDPSLFTSIKEKPLKILIALIDKILVSNENDTIFEILNDILNLNEEQINLLSKQIKNASLENIISTIETLQKREIAIHKLRELMVKCTGQAKPDTFF